MTSTIKVNTITTESGSTLTIGGCGKTVALASGASQTGFGREGSVDWQTGSIKTSTFTPVSGEGYFVDTSSGAVTANLPAGSAGAIVAFSDYTRSFGTNALTISPNGSEKIGGVAAPVTASVNGQALTLVYVDGTKGWINVQNAEDTEFGNAFVIATGGTETTSGDFKIHTFTGPGTFQVTDAGQPTGSNTIEYLVVAGGGAGANDLGGGGGAGGYRSVYPVPSTGGLPVAVASYPVTVGAGGARASTPSIPGPTKGSNGSNSVFSGSSTITSTGGGAGGGSATPGPAQLVGSPGGSGGGGSGYGNPSTGPGGTGNTPPVSPPQGNNGGTSNGGTDAYPGAGGGGSAAVGGTPPGVGAAGSAGGAGTPNTIDGNSFSWAGGGGGAAYEPGASAGNGGVGGGGGGGKCGAGTGPAPSTVGTGGAGLNPGADGSAGPAGVGGPPSAGGAGGANTGGGGGGGAHNGTTGAIDGNAGGTGGSGIVIIRYKFQ